MVHFSSITIYRLKLFQYFLKYCIELMILIPWNFPLEIPRIALNLSIFIIIILICLAYQSFSC